MAVRVETASVDSPPKKFTCKQMERNRAEAGEECEVEGSFPVSADGKQTAGSSGEQAKVQEEDRAIKGQGLRANGPRLGRGEPPGMAQTLPGSEEDGRKAGRAGLD